MISKQVSSKNSLYCIQILGKERTFLSELLLCVLFQNILNYVYFFPFKWLSWLSGQPCFAFFVISSYIFFNGDSYF